MSKNNKLVKKAYNDSILLLKGFGANLKLLLHKIGFNHVWNNQSTFSKHKLIHSVTEKLKQSYILSFWKKINI